MVPPILYKYTTSSTAEIVLKTGKLRWSSPTVFNDLAEFQRMPRFHPTISESYRLFHEVIVDVALGLKKLDDGRLVPNARLYLEQMRNLVSSGSTKVDLLLLPTPKQDGADAHVDATLRMVFKGFKPEQARIMCLTSTCDNEVMWGTYADNHFGCVLGFKHIPEKSTPFLEAKQVAYSELPPVIGSGVDLLLYGNSPDLPASTMSAVCFSKKLNWLYEQEWRALTWRREEIDCTHTDFKFFPEELESVTFGARATPELVETLTSLVRAQYPDAKLYRMQTQQDQLIRTLRVD